MENNRPILMYAVLIKKHQRRMSLHVIISEPQVNSTDRIERCEYVCVGVSKCVCVFVKWVCISFEGVTSLITVMTWWNWPKQLACTVMELLTALFLFLSSFFLSAGLLFSQKWLSKAFEIVYGVFSHTKK
jgi:hypothetical protein